MRTCKVCKLKIGKKGFPSHLKLHALNIEQYYTNYVKAKDTKDGCLNCGRKTKFLGIESGYQKFCGCSCAQSSKQTKKKQRAAHLGRPRRDMYGERNPAKRKEVREKISKAMLGNTRTLGRTATTKQRKAISKRVELNWKNDPLRKLAQSDRARDNNLCYKQGWYFSEKLHKDFYYRSSYELAALKLLDSLTTVKEFSYESLAIPYKHEGKCKHYIPDFVVITKRGFKNCILEIKPKHMLSQRANVEKFAAAEKFASNLGMIFKVWTEDRLFSYIQR
jgi:hypothetical protein